MRMGAEIHSSPNQTWYQYALCAALQLLIKALLEMINCCHKCLVPLLLPLVRPFYFNKEEEISYTNSIFATRHLGGVESLRNSLSD